MSLGSDISLADLEADPDPILARMRAEEPVCWVPSMEMWLVTRWHDVVVRGRKLERRHGTVVPG